MIAGIRWSVIIGIYWSIISGIGWSMIFGICIQSFIWTLVVLIFVVSGFTIELHQLGFLPFVSMPFSPLYSIHVAFTAVLIIELIEVMLSFSRSFSISVAKQVEIFSLILLRQTFEVLTKLETIQEDLQRTSLLQLETLIQVLEGGVGLMLLELSCALAIFALITVQQNISIHKRITEDEETERSFIQMKKLISLTLIFIFIGFIGIKGHSTFFGTEEFPLFQNVYLSLIYADVLLVLISYRFNNSYALVFRNSSLAGCTLLIRLALSAPPAVGALLGLSAALLLPLIAYTYRNSVSHLHDEML